MKQAGEGETSAKLFCMLKCETRLNMRDKRFIISTLRVWLHVRDNTETERYGNGG